MMLAAIVMMITRAKPKPDLGGIYFLDNRPCISVNPVRNHMLDRVIPY